MNPFNLSSSDIKDFLIPNNSPFPELSQFKNNIEIISNSRQMSIVWESSKNLRENLGNIPDVSESLYKSFQETGDRKTYEEPYNNRRKQLSVATLLFLLGQKDLEELIENYLLEICNEFTWVVPAHEGRLIDIYSSETGLTLADVVNCLGDNLSKEVKDKVYKTIDKRIFKPYLEKTSEHKWYQSSDNWNAVCNSQIACTFLLLEKDLERKANALELVLKGLSLYIESSFDEDGSTTEGVKYWHYGMTWFTVFSEMLLAATKGSINLLNLEKVKKIATFPSNMQLAKGIFASFSDSEEKGTTFHPGIIQRLYERTYEKTLLNLIAEPVKPDSHSITSLLRFLLWWNGNSANAFEPKDIILPNAGIVKLTSKTKNGNNIVLIAKAGNNGENHNHNDIGSFILNINGENLLTDPGPGLYDKNYFNENRYENIFANSYGHSVPKINNKLQSMGKEHFGSVLKTQIEKVSKNVLIDITHAYDDPSLLKATRLLF